MQEFINYFGPIIKTLMTIYAVFFMIGRGLRWMEIMANTKMRAESHELEMGYHGNNTNKKNNN